MLLFLRRAWRIRRVRRAWRGQGLRRVRQVWKFQRAWKNWKRRTRVEKVQTAVAVSAVAVAGGDSNTEEEEAYSAVVSAKGTPVKKEEQLESKERKIRIINKELYFERLIKFF